MLKFSIFAREACVCKLVRKCKWPTDRPDHPNSPLKTIDLVTVFWGLKNGVFSELNCALKWSIFWVIFGNFQNDRFLDKWGQNFIGANFLAHNIPHMFRGFFYIFELFTNARFACPFGVCLQTPRSIYFFVFDGFNFLWIMFCRCWTNMFCRINCTISESLLVLLLLLFLQLIYF